MELGFKKGVNAQTQKSLQAASKGQKGRRRDYFERALLHPEALKSERGVNLGNLPLPCEYKIKSLDRKLAVFFQKRGRPRPRTLAPRSLQQYFKNQVTFPQISPRKRAYNPLPIEQTPSTLTLHPRSHPPKVSQTVPTQQSCTIQPSPNLSRKKMRKLSIQSSKKKYQDHWRFTNSGWSEGRGQGALKSHNRGVPTHF